MKANSCCRPRSSCADAASARRPLPTPAKAGEAQFGDAQKEQQLREQHRLVLDAIREGKLDNVLDQPEAEALAAVKELDVQWLNAESVHADRNLTMQLRVTEGGAALRRAPDLPLCPSRCSAFYTQAVADSGGAAEIKIEVDEAAICRIRRCWCKPTSKAAPPPRKFVLRKAEVVTDHVPRRHPDRSRLCRRRDESREVPSRMLVARIIE